VKYFKCKIVNDCVRLFLSCLKMCFHQKEYDFCDLVFVCVKLGEIQLKI
jgi:hypothetical protein